MIKYAIVRYVDDLTRNEAVNVGVIVYDGERAMARFDGEDPKSHAIDLRRIRHRITGSYTYRSWVAFWRRALVEPAVISPSLAEAHAGDAAIIDYLIGLGGDEFSIVHGGEILLDADERDLGRTLTDLYERVVRAEEPPAPPSLRDKSHQALVLAGAPIDDQHRFKEQAQIDLNVRGTVVTEEVSYAVLNGRWHYAQEASFDPRSVRNTRKEAHHAAFIFEYANVDSNGLILYDETDVVDKTRGLLDVISAFAKPVDVSRPEEAAPLLRKALSLA